MTITLSPEVEADIRELMRLWGWDANDQLLAQAAAIGATKDGLRMAIDLANDLNTLRNRWAWDTIHATPPRAQSVPDARVFEEHDHHGLRWVTPLPPEPPAPGVCMDIAEGTEVSTAGGRLLVWRGGKWWAKEEGGAK